MGREVRMVPPHWKHPKKWNPAGEYPQPMYDRTYEEAADEWMKEYADFLANPKEMATAKKADAPYFWDWHGQPPDKEYYRPYKSEDATWYQLWETVSEGTPVSPPFATKEKLAQYLAVNGDDWDKKRGNGGWGLERARAFVESGWAPSGAVLGNGVWLESKDIPWAQKKDRK